MDWWSTRISLLLESCVWDIPFSRRRSCEGSAEYAGWFLRAGNTGPRISLSGDTNVSNVSAQHQCSSAQTRASSKCSVAGGTSMLHGRVSSSQLKFDPTAHAMQRSAFEVDGRVTWSNTTHRGRMYAELT